MRKSILLCVLLVAVCAFSVLIYGNDELYRYSDTSIIDVEHTSEFKVGKVEEIDRYTKGGIEYIEISTTATGNNVYAISEEEYDKYIGIGNDAFDCEVFYLYLLSKVFEYNHNIFGESDLEDIDIDFLNEYAKECNLDYKFTTIPELGRDKTICVTSDGITIEINFTSDMDRSKDIIYTSMEQTRYAVFGKEDFSEEEIGMYIRKMDEINKFILDAVDNM